MSTGYADRQPKHADRAEEDGPAVNCPQEAASSEQADETDEAHRKKQDLEPKSKLKSKPPPPKLNEIFGEPKRGVLKD
ncbi:hypothetical protein HPB47_011192 [Ixodes persulcatus]|uniref:Uncharacterized protein n=1 Tax=Ixodes persulcatus TaxID=34615 RepID=A0AC60NWZ3_IXOPE|nr:hypothetical protein HPB47_011192 [Ixodes persulcatus]